MVFNFGDVINWMDEKYVVITDNGGSGCVVLINDEGYLFEAIYRFYFSYGAEHSILLGTYRELFGEEKYNDFIEKTKNL